MAAAAARKAGSERVEAESADDLDVSGYGIEVQALSMPACSASVTIAKGKPSSLAGDHFLYVRSTDGAAHATAVAYPTSGDVDTGILINDDIECKVSEKAKGNLDIASCTNSACNAARDTVTAVIANPTSSSAKFIGAFTLVYSN
jgi:hypothetical protein